MCGLANIDILGRSEVKDLTKSREILIPNDKELNCPIDLYRYKCDGNFFPMAPSDAEQVQLIGESLTQIEGLPFDQWKHLSVGERLQILQKAECKIAEIAQRSFCEIKIEKLSKKNFGYYSPANKTITLNSRYISDSSFANYKETLDTLFHEGRHAYQDYNLTVREVHPSPGDITNWRLNENKYGYQSSSVFGMKLYVLQPVECDARKFAEDVFKKFNEKL